MTNDVDILLLPMADRRELFGRRHRVRLERAAARQWLYRRRKGLIKNRPPGPPARPVRVVELDFVHPSIEAAARAVGGTCRPGNIRRAIKRGGCVGPYHYEWAEISS